jgi:hypothetical protein
VIHREWTGYADQKQFAMGQATGAWILNLDADEYVPDGLASEIRCGPCARPAIGGGVFHAASLILSGPLD